MQLISYGWEIDYCSCTRFSSWLLFVEDTCKLGCYTKVSVSMTKIIRFHFTNLVTLAINLATISITCHVSIKNRTTDI